MSKKLHNLLWHDGNLSSIIFIISKQGKSSLAIEASFYKTEQATSRDNYKITCESVINHNVILNSKRLTENKFAGNISNGYLKENTLWVYFSDGVLEVTANKFKITRR